MFPSAFAIAGDLNALRTALLKLDPDLEVNLAASGVSTVKFTDTAIQARQRSAVDQSIEIVRRRIDETGTKEPTIQREGEDRILVQLPGVENPEHVKELLGRTAKMTFQLVDTDVAPGDARPGNLPPGDELLPSADNRPGGPQFYVVKRRVMVSGDTLTDSQPTFQNGNEPVVSFNFNSTGARRFGDATSSNVGKPFAIVLDNKVISAPVIREPILGGRGVISGNFTVQSASDLALLLRAGALPAPLTVLEERTVGPDLGADSIRAGTTACLVGRGAGGGVHDRVLRLVRLVRRHRAVLQFMHDAGESVLARRHADVARHRRHRAHHGHGGRRQCADL